MADYLALAKEAFDASTTYLDANYRADLDYSLRAFRNEHASGSKYLSEEYKSRSRLFPPHTRTIIRKNEAAGMQAAFSNREVVNVEAGNPDDVMSVASAAAMKEVMEYRLSRTIPAFELYLGGLQDAMTTGSVCSYQYWEYQKKPDGTKVKDQPCIELRPVENLRLDAGASWLDPVGTTPYFCDIVPMYVCDVKAMMKNKDDKTGNPKWKTFEDSVILKARPDSMDTTRKARLGNKQDPHEETSAMKNFDIVWVLRWFMKDSQGSDRIFYTLGTEEMLTDDEPIDKAYFHGKRPYVMGYAVLETHKAFKTGLPMLTKHLQQESAEITNQRIDNVKFVLNKRWIVARGRQVDVQSLVRNVPGGVTLTTDPNLDVKESNWPDVTSSAYAEHDRVRSMFDDLAGNFSPGTKVANNAVNDTLGGSKIAAAGAGLMTEYLLHTVNVTWWERVMRQLALLEQHYETDEVVLAVCANKAKLFPRFGLSRITDMMLMSESNVTVSMAMGDPNQRLQKFIAVAEAVIKLIAEAPPGVNVSEMAKEMWSNAGYRDGERFMGKEDPRIAKAMQMIQQLQGQLKGKQMEIQAQGQIKQLEIQSAERVKGAQLKVDEGRIRGDLQLRNRELDLKEADTHINAAKVHSDMNKIEPPVDPEMQQLEKGEILAKIDLTVAQADKARKEAGIAEATDMASVNKTNAEASKLHAEANAITAPMNEHAQGLADIRDALAATNNAVQETFSRHAEAVNGDIGELRKGLGAMAQVIMTPKPKPKGFRLKKDGKKTQAVVVDYHDGTSEEMPVQ